MLSLYAKPSLVSLTTYTATKSDKQSKVSFRSYIGDGAGLPLEWRYQKVKEAHLEFCVLEHVDELRGALFNLTHVDHERLVGDAAVATKHLLYRSVEKKMVKIKKKRSMPLTLSRRIISVRKSNICPNYHFICAVIRALPTPLINGGRPAWPLGKGGILVINWQGPY